MSVGSLKSHTFLLCEMASRTTRTQLANDGLLSKIFLIFCSCMYIFPRNWRVWKMYSLQNCVNARIDYGGVHPEMGALQRV